MTERQGPMYRAVCAAIRETKADKLDAGTVALARYYAHLIDAAAPNAKYAKALRALRVAASNEGTLEAAEGYDKVADALAQHSVASDLGPKLLAALTALGLTPAARKAAMKGSTDVSRTPRVNPLAAQRDELAAQRAKHGGGAG